MSHNKSTAANEHLCTPENPCRGCRERGVGPAHESEVASDDRCWVNNGGFALDGKTHMTGAQIRALPMPSIRDTDDLYMEVPGSEDLIVQYDEVVPVTGRRFFSVPSIINAGSSDAAYLQETLDEIAANQRVFEQTRSLRKQYRLCLANEPLFARLGIEHPPMLMQQPPRGIGQRIVWWWLNR